MGVHDVIGFYNKQKYRQLKELRREEESLDNKIEKAREKLQKEREKERARLNKK